MVSERHTGSGSWRTDGTRDNRVVPFVVGSVRSHPQRSSCVESRRDGVVTVHECQSTPRYATRPSTLGHQKEDRSRILVSNGLAALSDTPGLAKRRHKRGKKKVSTFLAAESAHPFFFLRGERYVRETCNDKRVHRGTRYPRPVRQ